LPCRLTSGVPQSIVNGIRTAYDVAREGPDVLLVHGWMASRRYWHEARDRLTGFRIWAVDLYGYGDSEKPVSGYTLDSYAAFLAGFLDSQHMEKVAIVGHSMGGAVAAWAALRFPRRFWALSLVDAALAGLARPPPVWTAQPLMRTFMRLADLSKRLGVMTVKGILGLDEKQSLMVFEEARKADVRAALECGEMMSTPTDWRGLKSLDVPTLVVYGEDDFLTDQDVDHRMRSLLPRAAFNYVPDCGHLPMLEKPKEFYGLLLSFLAKNTP